MNDMSKVSWPGWEIVRKIGSGSFGSVYEIQRDVFGDVERAALKVITIPQSRSDIEELLNEGYDEASVTERFRGYLQDIAREYSLMAKMKGHTNVVYCDDIRYVQHDDGIGWDIYIKMELLTPLMTTLSNNIPEETAIRVGRDICSALVLCKQQKIVHRDIKPQNIFVSASGEYKLGDFGIAKTAEKTTGGTKIGTYKYMAPEVYNNQPYGAAADIYSLGLVMYWLLNARRTPFLPLPPQTPSASVEDEARRRRFSGEPIPAPVGGSPALKRIVLKACAYDTRDRYASAEEMLADLKALGETAAVPVAPIVAAAAVSRPQNDERTVSTAANSNMPDADGTVGAFRGSVAAADSDATIGTWSAAPNAPVYKPAEPPKAAPAAAPAAPVATPAAVPQPLGDDERTVSTFSSNKVVDEDATVGVFGARAAAVDDDATVGTWNTAPKAPARKAAEAPKPAAAPVATPVEEPTPVKNKEEKKTEKPAAKKKSWIPFAGIGAAVVVLIVVLMMVLGGGDKADNVVNDGGTTVHTSPTGGNNANGDPVDDENPSAGASLSGEDIFGGDYSPEMLWGHYEAVNYEYNGSSEDAAAFLEGMEYFTVPTERGDYEYAVLPVSFHAGKYSHFMGSFMYEGKYYDPYTEKGRAMFRKAYIAEVGDMTEEEFKKIEAVMDLDVMEIYAVDKNGRTYIIMLNYRINGNKLDLYEVAIDDDFNIAYGSAPIMSCEVRHNGGRLQLLSNGVLREYCADGFKKTDDSLTITGYARTEEDRYEDIEGISFYDYGEDHEGNAYVYLTDGDTAIDPVMTVNRETGEFTLSWKERWTTYNGYTEKQPDDRTITGKIVLCSSYGWYNHRAFFLFVDGQCYRYLMTSDEYDEIAYGDLLDDDSDLEYMTDSEKDTINAAKKSILEELKEAFDAADIQADIDFTTGRVTLEANFLFDVNSTELSAEGIDYLNRFADAYCSVIVNNEYAEYIANIIIEGHTDTSGSYSLNQALSEGRANAVANQCITRNSLIEPLIEARGCSYDYPIYNADGTVNMDASRRVTFRFVFATN